MRLPLFRSPSRLALPTLNLLLALLAGLSFAYWGWLLWQGTRAPRVAPAESASPAASTATAAPAIAAHLFAPAVASGNAAQARGDFKLAGTFAGQKNRPGYAIIVGADGKPASFARGAEVAPGVVLQEIAADHVLLRRDGNSEKLELPSKGGANLIVPVR